MTIANQSNFRWVYVGVVMPHARAVMPPRTAGRDMINVVGVVNIRVQQKLLAAGLVRLIGMPELPGTIAL